MSIVELRQYTLHPGARETLIELFEREFVTGQRAVGITVGGRFRDLDDPDRFVWLRAFPDMVQRRRALEAFYTGSVWQRHRDAANATMIDSDDVLLLRGPCFTPRPGTHEVAATVCRPSDTAAFDAYAARHLGPGHALHRTAPSTLRTTIPCCPSAPGKTSGSGSARPIHHPGRSNDCGWNP
ncbi:NIPSNAP family protein [Streptomyces bungoensis]